MSVPLPMGKHKAQCTYRCSFCHDIIMPGELYELQIVTSNGHYTVVKKCTKCANYVDEFFERLMSNSITSDIEHDTEWFEKYMESEHPEILEKWKEGINERI